MRVENAYLKPLNDLAFKHPSGVYGLITGIKLVKRKEYSKIYCYEVTWIDRVEYIPISDIGQGIYKLHQTAFDINSMPFNKHIIADIFKNCYDNKSEKEKEWLIGQSRD
jgi:hypothetical protein